MPIRSENFLIRGPAGSLDLCCEEPGDGMVFRGWGIVLHPHPLMGGSMAHKVPYILSRALIDLGYCSVRFNFRGVGRSEGVYDEGRGEIEDTLAVLQWTKERYGHLPYSALFSFSFGAFVASHVAHTHLFSHIVLSGLPSSRFDCCSVPPHSLVIHGEHDELIPLDSVLSWAEPQNLPVVVFPRASHFFDHKLVPLKKFIVFRCSLTEQ